MQRGTLPAQNSVDMLPTQNPAVKHSSLMNRLQVMARLLHSSFLSLQEDPGRFSLQKWQPGSSPPKPRSVAVAYCQWGFVLQLLVLVVVPRLFHVHKATARRLNSPESKTRRQEQAHAKHSRQ